ncbi:putative mitochondrial protein [Cucumis melo var. makuwa]|uniref:Mitochondrial protein n=1 Tax=Cucumis melo var. makuwa TaxID=1194695 RepID=A0A5D3DNI7_CUCMM|nr:putative mitochondrial protein [Cucumis melo var. makuwa]TYK24840.1 putative mitochondrial protein [Cucumis melo var. makuwa]
MQLYHDVLLIRQHLGFVRDRQCNSIMTLCCFLGFLRDRRCNSIMTPLSVHFAFIYSLFQDHVISTNLLLVILFCRTMVYFIERFLSRVRHLVVYFDRNQPREDGLSLLMEKPWAGSFADHWSRLDNNSILPRFSVEIPLSEGKIAWVIQSSIHNKATNSDRALTLGQCLIEDQTRWGAVTKVPGEFCFIDCYWEWLELVVGRNA